MLRIPRRFSHFVFGFIQSGLTSALAAAVASSTLPSPLSHWLHSWLTAWVLMLPIIFLAAPLIHRLVFFLTHNDDRQGDRARS